MIVSTSALLPSCTDALDTFHYDYQDLVIAEMPELIISSYGHSSHQLLVLPAELLTLIIAHLAIDKSSLSSLASVSSVWRELARKHRFVDVTLGFSRGAGQLVMRLLADGKNEQGSHPIGPCVRWLTVQSDWAWRMVREDLTGRSLSGVAWNPKVRGGTELDKTVGEYQRNYSKRLSVAVTSSMTRLVGVQWEGGLVDNDLLRALARTSTEHLSLRSVRVERPSTILPIWALRSLHLDITLLWDEKVEYGLIKNGSMTAREREQAHQERVADCISFTVSLLKQCAPTLERFQWVDSNEKHQYKAPVSLGNLDFPRLRHFRSHAIPFAADTLAAFYAAPLDELELGWGKVYQQDRGNYVQNLVSLPRLAQLRALALGRLEVCIERADCYFLDRRVIPLLGSGLFTTLTSLSLFREEVDMELGGQMPVVIDEACLAAIGTIISLEQLCLEAGHTLGELYDDPSRDLLDHTSVREHFKGLKQLRKLAMGRTWEPGAMYQDCGLTRRPDEFERNRACERFSLDVDINWFETVMRYRRPRPQHIADVPIQSAQGCKSDLDDLYSALPDLEILKLSHRNLFLAEAEQYAAVLPDLEWLFIGGWPIAVSKPSSSHFGNAVPLSYNWVVSCAWEELKNSIFALGSCDTMTHGVPENVMHERRMAYLRDVGSSQGHACPGRNLPRINRRPTG
ncbi:hypothetical protein LTR27_009396 [Elasticomyces elasticus]|nr:hypothetical protein LTR27_009396 [Elasticomyces elasticus]